MYRILRSYNSIRSIMLLDIVGAVFAIVCLLFVTIPDIPQTGEKVRIFSNMKLGLQER